MSDPSDRNHTHSPCDACLDASRSEIALEAEVARLKLELEAAEKVENCGAEPCAFIANPPREFGPTLCLWHEAKAHAQANAHLAEAERAPSGVSPSPPGRKHICNDGCHDPDEFGNTLSADQWCDDCTFGPDPDDEGERQG